MADAKTSLGGISRSLEKRTPFWNSALAGFFTKVKRFFGLDKKKDKREEIDTNNKEIEPLKE